MAERSFKREVQQLRIAPGEEFRGEGILAVTKALLQSGVSYVAGYQGAPISHLMDVLADASEILEELGVHFENSASEAAAAATLAASVMYPIRGAVTWKSTVGTNVASDALANLASGGVKGGALVIVGEDYGEGSSIMQERTHAFAMKSQIWLLDPRPNLESMVDAVETGFQLSEASNTPVILQLRIRSCHVHGRFITKENKRPEFTLEEALNSPQRDTSRVVLPPASFAHEHEKIEARWPAAIKYIKDNKLNEVFEGDLNDIGIIVQGGLYNGAIRALQLLGLADHFGNCSIPMYVMNVTYPLIDDELIEFCQDKKSVLLLEEGQPNYIEQNIQTILRNADSTTKLCGKNFLPMAGEYTTAVMRDGIQDFLTEYQPDALPEITLAGISSGNGGNGTATVIEARRNGNGNGKRPTVVPASPTVVPAQTDAPTPEEAAPETAKSNGNGKAQAVVTDLSSAPDQSATAMQAFVEPSDNPEEMAQSALKHMQEMASVVPQRPAGFCTGCPERPVFSALTLAQKNLGEHHIASDIGCHLFSILPPFNLGATTMGYGLAASSASAFNTSGKKGGKRAISIMGDGGFWHNGLSSGIGNAVYNEYDGVIIIIDNFYAAATGGQDLLSSRSEVRNRSTNNTIEDAVRGVGVKWVRVIDHTYDVTKMQAAIEEALTTPETGPKVIIAQSECMLNKQRRERPKVRKAINDGKRVVRERFGVDSDVCTGDHECIRLSGCPSLTIKDSEDPLRVDPIAYVDNTCVGCGHCGDVSHAAVLCPSFYRADIIENPNKWDLFKARVSERVINFLQERNGRRLTQHSF